MGPFSERKKNGRKEYVGQVEKQIQCVAAEVGAQDIDQTIVIGIASVIAHQAQADSMEEEIIRFVEENTDGEILEIDVEIR